MPAPSTRSAKTSSRSRQFAYERLEQRIAVKNLILNGELDGVFVSKQMPEDALEHLRSEFRNNQQPSPSVVQSIADTVCMPKAKIRNWFANERQKAARERRRCQERDSMVRSTSSTRTKAAAHDRHRMSMAIRVEDDAEARSLVESDLEEDVAMDEDDPVTIWPSEGIPDDLDARKNRPETLGSISRMSSCGLHGMAPWSSGTPIESRKVASSSGAEKIVVVDGECTIATSKGNTRPRKKQEKRLRYQPYDQGCRNCRYLTRVLECAGVLPPEADMAIEEKEAALILVLMKRESMRRRAGMTGCRRSGHSC